MLAFRDVRHLGVSTNVSGDFVPSTSNHTSLTSLPIHAKRSTLTLAHADLFHPAICFGKSLRPSSCGGKIQVQKEKFYRGALNFTADLLRSSNVTPLQE